MGEVRVKLKLINSGDEYMARCGKISPKEVRVYETEATVETNIGFAGFACSRRSGIRTPPGSTCSETKVIFPL